VWARQKWGYGQNGTQLCSCSHPKKTQPTHQLLAASCWACRAGRAAPRRAGPGHSFKWCSVASSQSLFRQSIVLQFPHCEDSHPLAWVAKITRSMAPRLDRSKWVPRATGKAVYCLTDRDVRSRLIGCGWQCAHRPAPPTRRRHHSRLAGASRQRQRRPRTRSATCSFCPLPPAAGWHGV
jgi:hypothetical protein